MVNLFDCRTKSRQPLSDNSRALLVADAPGHIIDRMAKSWIRHNETSHELLNSGVTPSFSICRRARELGLVYWLDQIAYQALHKAVRAPQVVMVHHLTEDCLEQGVASLDSCDAITTSSILWQRKLELLTGRPVVRIPYSVDTNVFRPPVNKSRERLAAGVGEGQFVLGFLGKATANQSNRKGVDVLEAVLKVAAQRLGNISLVLVGPGWESLAGRVRAAGVHVIQRQYQTTEETAHAYALMDALLVTSSEEGGPCTILEAMACEVPVITSIVGHVNEVVSDGITGFTCPSRNPREYLARLQRLAGDPELRRRIAAAGRNSILRERADDVVIPRIDFSTLYEGAVRRFENRNGFERALRVLPSACLFARRFARPLRRMGGVVQPV